MTRVRVDTFDSQTPPRVLVLEGEAQVLAAIVDGTGSWGSGREAADHARERLLESWRSKPQWSVHRLARDIAAVAASMPDELRDRDFGWSFSIACLLCAEQVVTCVAAGIYRVDVLGPSGVRTLFRPRMLVDQLLADGTLTPATAREFPHRDIFMEAFIGDKESVAFTTARHDLGPDDVVVVTHASRFDLDSLSPPTFAAKARQDAPPSPVIVARR